MQTEIIKALMGAAGGGDKVYVDDVYSTTVYKGNGASSRQIQNGVDLGTEGGLVWIKDLGQSRNHYLFDSSSLAGSTYNQYLSANTTGQLYSGAGTGNGLSGPFLTNGFTTGNNHNTNNRHYASFSFRKAPGFFDIVTYTGTGSTQTIAHNLGSVPGCIMVKCRDASENWAVYHRGMASSSPEDYVILLNQDSGRSNSQSAWNDTAPSSTHFTVKNNMEVNGNGQSYVAYLFAHDDQSFGTAGNTDVIKCGSMTLSGGEATVDLGWEPQFLMIKRSNGTGDWAIYDAQTEGLRKGDKLLFRPNTAATRGGANYPFDTTSTGFKVINGWALLGGAGTTEHIYIAIRRSDGYVGKPIEAGTEAFAMDTGAGSSNIPNFDSGFPVDFCLTRKPASSDNWYTGASLLGTRFLKTNTNSATSDSSNFVFDLSSGWNNYSSWSSNEQSWMFKRHAGLDVQLYKGITGQQSRQHSLNAVPEMIWAKSTNNAYEWAIGHKDLTGGWTSNHLRFTTSAEISGQQFALAPTSTHWTTPNGGLVNDNNEEYIAILFASVNGISKVGSYTGNNTSGSPNTQEITVGFQPRFIMIKKYSGTGDWRVLDSVRGWPAGSTVDPALKFNSNAAQDSGYNLIQAIGSTSFTLSDSGLVNANGAEFIYYAHA